MTHLGDDPIGRAAVHEVIVDAIACLRGEGHTIGIVIKLRGWIVLPVETPALHGLQDILEILEIWLFHTLVLATTVHLTVLDRAEAVNGLILIEEECLAHLEFFQVLPDGTPPLFTQKHTAFGGAERKAHHGRIVLDNEFTAFPSVALFYDLHLLRLGGNHQALRRLALHDVYNTWCEELYLHVWLCQRCDGRKAGGK